MLAVQESAHDWQVPGESVSYRREGTSMSSISGTGGELLCPARVLAVQESAHDWQVPGESVSYREGGGGGELLCAARVLTVQESAHDWQGGSTSSPSRSQLMIGKYQVSLYRTGGGGRTTMSSPCAHRPGVSS